MRIIQTIIVFFLLTARWNKLRRKEPKEHLWSKLALYFCIVLFNGCFSILLFFFLLLYNLLKMIMIINQIWSKRSEYTTFEIVLLFTASWDHRLFDSFLLDLYIFFFGIVYIEKSQSSAVVKINLVFTHIFCFRIKSKIPQGFFF